LEEVAEKTGRAAGTARSHIKDAALTFGSLCAAWRENNFDPIAWQREHAYVATSLNVFYLLAAADVEEDLDEIEIGPDERLPDIFSKANDWLAAQEIDDATKAMAVRVFGLDGNPPDSFAHVAGIHGVHKASVQRRMRKLLGMTPWKRTPDKP